MKWFYNLKIGTKLILGFVVVALIAGGIGVMGSSISAPWTGRIHISTKR